LPENGRIPDDVWKYLTAVGFSLLIGVIGGQFIPNRNIVTTDQLNAATLVLQQSQLSTNSKVDELAKQVATMNGELAAQHLVHPQ
jgi:hypothetical protein